jgi:hypothetical protein
MEISFICRTVEESYTFFVRHTFKKDFNMKFSEFENKLIEKFAFTFTKTFDHFNVKYFYDYHCFQFSYWSKLTFTQSIRKGIPDISWIIGPKAWDRWIDQKGHIESWKYSQFSDKVLFQDYLNFIKFKDPTHKTEYNKVFEVEEKERARFLNEMVGFYNCLSFTSLINPISESCKVCNSQERCLGQLEKLYPNIYLKRYGAEVL